MIGVIDYGAGNIRSITRGLQAAGAESQVFDDGGDLAAADAIVLPGVGHAGQLMAAFDARGFTGAILKAVGLRQTISWYLRRLADHVRGAGRRRRTRTGATGWPRRASSKNAENAAHGLEPGDDSSVESDWALLDRQTSTISSTAMPLTEPNLTAWSRPPHMGSLFPAS